MEEIKFDELERVSLKKEVFLKLPLLRKYVYSEENYKKLIKYVHDIHLQPTERILDAISYVNDALVQEYGQRITQETQPLYYSSLLWEWIYLLAYYLHQIDEDPQWLENFLPHMKNFQIRPAALSEMEQGEKLIDKYLDIRWKVMKTQQRLDNPTADTNSQLTTSIETQYQTHIADLESQLAQKEAENTQLHARIAELEAQQDCYLPSFLVTLNKRPEDIKGACRSIARATSAPADMAQCLHELQVQNFLKNQDRTGKLKNVHKIFDELQEQYHFDWKIGALYRALNRIISKK